MNKLLIILFLLLTTLVSAQNRQPLQGLVISDTLKIEYLSVINLSTKKDTITDEAGNFMIDARVTDTLRFAGALVQTIDYVLQENDFKEELFIIRVSPDATMLKEVVISGLTGNLATDSKNTEVTLLNSQFKTAEINEHVYNSPGFVGLFKMIFKKKPGTKKATRYKYKQTNSFPIEVRNRYDDNYFTETLSIPQEDIMKFLYYADTRTAYHLLEPNKELELLQFLREKSMEYLKHKEEN
ncbi:hypothetical protein GCM10007424_22870 [Flavobacterium suaedae]|uniref:Carboxypeptidase-like regulatory domain-containing protein n=1 Tax=Flavobacterium suaedae TaxID=1767027 RepID=A0ABQ1K1R5_9FLAO|nr:hypothetical protein [Flavobacterium suaedae]GGB82275.1 hypothetical protein GCM10007424_22870 [Flavobacterium suaedae]